MLFRKKNIFLANMYEENIYTSQGAQGNEPKIKPRDINAHGKYIRKQLDAVWSSADRRRKAMFATIKQRGGTYIEFRGADNCELITNSLENAVQGIKLLNVREEESNANKVCSATVYVPNGKEDYFNKKVQEYIDKKTPKGKPRHKDLVESIETVRLAVVSSFWIGNINNIPNDIPIWCEIWLWSETEQETKTIKNFEILCSSLNIDFKSRSIVFPERVVVLAKVNIKQIQQLIDSCDNIAEFRRAPETASFFVDIGNSELREWIDDAKDRIEVGDPASYICILDTGVNNGHPLLKDVIEDSLIQSVDDKWNSNDHDGHGTMMAGICEYNDLESLLSGSEKVTLMHQLESIKVLPNNGSQNNPELYGAITKDATSLADIYNPNVNRVFCMAVTADKYVTEDGSPSSWSAELDSIISGAEDNERKLFMVSAGNVTISELENLGFTNANIMHQVEDPGQSWNALTIGAYSNKLEVVDEVFRGWSPVADVGELCPFSSTSLLWEDKWPIKPEILFDGGNAITDGKNFDTCDDLSLLTTNWKPMHRYFTTLNATSAATAQAAYMAARIMEEYPGIWYETVRSLMVHSAEWTKNMKKQFCQDDKKTTGRKQLLRTCGYGVANLERAMESMNNSVNMIIQAELQPYCKVEGRYKTKDMHLHKLPWPKDMLYKLENTPVSMKLTLSYYIEPAPGEKGWKDKYRYSSCGLRFDVNNSNEGKEDFIKRINVAMREERNDRGQGTSGSDRWYLGKDNRDVGSVHSDIWNGTAIQLADCNYVAIYPVIGWWRERHNLEMYDKKVRYSLIVTLATPDETIDFYTPIETIINTEIKTEIKIEV